jgi:hypothetical protein
LTNVLMTLASMMCYAMMARRVVAFPPAHRSPVAIEDLIDVKLTEKSVSATLPGLATGLLTGNETVEMFARGSVLSSDAVFYVKAAGLSLGSRRKSQSSEAGVAGGSLCRHIGLMQQLQSHQYVVHRNFFESFPFRSIAPLDVCSMMRLFVPSLSVRSAASRLLAALFAHRRSVAEPWAAIHLRVESDAHLVRSELGSQQSEHVVEWWRREVAPVLASQGVFLVYIAAGSTYSDALHQRLQQIESAAGRTLLRKQDMNLSSILRGIVAKPNSKTKVTSHAAAFVDALVVSTATIAMSFSGSTFPLLVMPRRCAVKAAGEFASLSPPVTPVSERVLTLMKAAWCTSAGTAVADPVPSIRSNTSQRTPCPSAFVQKLVSTMSVAGTPAEQEQPADRGMYLYDMDAAGGRFTKPLFYQCGHRNFLGQCFRDLKL